MQTKNQLKEPETVRLTSRLHLAAGTWFGRYRLLVEQEDGDRGLVRVCRSKAELAACLRSATQERGQARRERGAAVNFRLARPDERRDGPWFVAQEWVGCAYRGTWHDLAARDLQRRLAVV
jgi:hypothetical protein